MIDRMINDLNDVSDLLGIAVKDSRDVWSKSITYTYYEHMSAVDMMMYCDQSLSSPHKY